MLSLDKLIDDINSSNKIECHNIYDIWNNDSYSKSKRIDVITYNIKRVDRQELDKFIKEEAFPLLEDVNNDSSSNLKSSLRKLFYAYDLLINGDLKKI